ncbi:MAG: ketol-acid reductoisomerase [Puniceicoccaceae bacterium 5H]|nr:MAG: ketol-acid reductoisomerase [Puniceicoccaceae bacterium 5H]
MSAKVYSDAEASLAPIQDKTLAVIGFGSQGHAHALNLKDSGLNVIIGLYEGSKSVQVAKDLGFEVYNTAEAVQKADVIMIAVPDMKQKALYESEIEPNLSAGKTLLFVHGLAIHFKLIEAPKGVDVIMVAPKGPGHTVRSQYKEGKGVPSLIAVLEGSSAGAKDVALAWAKGIGGSRAGVIETSFREETETDLFGEQAVLCGGLSAMVKAGFETLVEAGYAPEMAYFECCHEMKLIVDMVVESGLSGMRFSISDTAEWGDYVSGPRVIGPEVKERMKDVLKDIQDGTFTKNWVAEHESGYKKLNQIREDEAKHPIEEVGVKLRSMMPWVKKANLKGAQASY